MMMFDKEIIVTVCAHSPEALEVWATAFQKFFGNATLTRGTGAWVDGRGITWHEEHIRVSHYYTEHEIDFDWADFDALVNRYKHKAEQQTVLVTLRDVQVYFH
jgi:hypothetical protein